MRIFASEENLLNPLGGGELSFETLLDRLADKNELLAAAKKGEKNHRTLFPVTEIPLFETRTHMFNKYFVFKQLEHILKRKVKDFSPDLVVTQQDFAAPTLKVASEYGIPSIVFMRNYEHLCLCSNPEQSCSRHCSECYGYGILNPYRYFVDIVFSYEKKWIQKASLVVSNSHYMAEVIKDWLGVNSAVIYPFVNEIEIKEYQPEYITLISPSKHKGIETFLEISRKLPQKRFLIVGHNPESINFSEYPNIKYMPWVDNPTEFYSKTRILLVPSIWPEPFGRVCIEAGFCGIPSIASRIGGLPEAVGKGGILIDRFEKPEKWVAAIEALEDETIYEECSRRAKRHAERFKVDNIIGEFKSLIKVRLGMEI